MMIDGGVAGIRSIHLAGATWRSHRLARTNAPPTDSGSYCVLLLSLRSTVDYKRTNSVAFVGRFG